MGYYTSYSFSETPNFTFDEVVKAKSVSEWVEEILRTEDCGIDGTWYEWKEDMVKLSALFPEHTLDLQGNGDETGDVWWAQFKGGEMVFHKRARMIWPGELASDELITLAREMYETEDILIRDDAYFEVVEDGIWVEAKVFIPKGE